MTMRVTEDELLLMLGENAIRFLNLDRGRLADIAKRIGRSVAEIVGNGPDIRPELLENFGVRSQFLAPSEGDTKIPMVDRLLRQGLAGFGVRA